MLAQDFTLESPELQRRLSTQLPQRLAWLRLNADRIRRIEWDVNLLRVLGDEAASLAPACEVLGASELAAHLELLGECALDSSERTEAPDADLAPAIDELLAAIAKAPLVDEIPGRGHAPGEVRIHADFSAPAPRIVCPPPRHWEHWPPEARPAPPSASPVTPSEPPSVRASSRHAPDIGGEPAPASSSGVRAAYVLAPTGQWSDDVGQGLSALGYDVSLVESAREVGELLTLLPPHLLVVDTSIAGDLATLGERLERIRPSLAHRMWTLFLAPSGELADRIALLRAGCDAVLAHDLPASSIVSRVDELTGAERSDPYRVMIIEDDRSQTLFAEGILRGAGMKTLTIEEPLAALDELEAFRPDLILMDLHLPEVSGLELTALIREREDGLATPIVFLSGDDDADIRFDALDAGGDVFLTKPIRPRHLIAAVSDRIRRARRVQRRLEAPTPEGRAGQFADRPAWIERLATLSRGDHAQAGAAVALRLREAVDLRARLGMNFATLMNEMRTKLTGIAGPSALLAPDDGPGFLLLDPEADLSELDTRLAGIRMSVAGHAFASAPDTHIDLDIGYRALPDKATSTASVVAQAIDAAFDARGAGRPVCVGPRQPSRAEDEPIADRIRVGLDDGSVGAVFQPIVSLRGEPSAQYQAMMRLAGRIREHTAAEVVPVADRAGLSRATDLFVLERSLDALEHTPRPPAMPRLFVCQSLASILADDGVDRIVAALDRRGIDGARLTIVIDAGLAQREPDGVARFAGCIGPRGVTLALSRFVGGGDGLALLAAIPAHYIALSARYVFSEADSVQEELAELVDTAHARGRAVIAPRVEDITHVAAMWTAGVDYVQGNFVHPAGHDLAFDFSGAIGG